MRLVSCGMVITIVALGLAGHASAAPVETVIYSFMGGTDGAQVNSSLVAGKDGALYGTTTFGGNNNNGTVFKLTPNAGNSTWTETVLYRFCPVSPCSDGANPIGTLIIDDQGALYGTTTFGGTNAQSLSETGNGTVFKLTPPANGQTTWTETVLYRFCPQSPSPLPCYDGTGPTSQLIFNNGAIYGTTQGGGNASNDGTVFKLTPPPTGTIWTETVLYSFCSQSNCLDGIYPNGTLIFDNNAIYGTTVYGGYANKGTVFKLVPTGRDSRTETVQYSFNGGSDGAYSSTGVIANNGEFYGVTAGGGNNNNGTVFKLLT
jgi:uncharacterized repeat protein (TIGR03803 family)